MDANRQTYEVENLELLYSSNRSPKEPELSNDTYKIAHDIRKNSSEPEPCPMKYLTKDDKKTITDALTSSMLPISKAWIIPWDLGERELSDGSSADVRIVDVVCAMKEDPLGSKPDVIRYQLESTLYDILPNAHVFGLCVWQNTIENCIPNEICPKYLPDYTCSI